MIETTCRRCGVEYEPTHDAILAGTWRECPACRNQKPSIPDQHSTADPTPKSDARATLPESLPYGCPGECAVVIDGQPHRCSGCEPLPSPIVAGVLPPRSARSRLDRVQLPSIGIARRDSTPAGGDA